MPRRIYAAAVDPAGAFPMQASRLVWSLTELAGVDPGCIVLHVVGIPEPGILSSLEGLGVELVHLDPYPGHAYCNKLQQLEPLGSRDFDDIVLLDCDIVVLEEPPGADGFVLGKPVDLGNPPIDLLQSIFEEAGLNLEPAVTDLDGAATVRANVNGGVYVIDRSVYSRLAESWRLWATWCLSSIEQFGVYENHVDQVSFAMAIASQEIPFRELPRRFNIPTHLAQSESLDCDPAILHYHTAVDTQQLLLPVPGLDRINAVISEVNSRLLSYRRGSFDNAAFWEARYAAHPDLGSGLGSRGEPLQLKRSLLTRTVELLGASSVIDVGGGDGMVAAGLPEHVSVVALDVADTARDLYLENNPGSIWINHDICVDPAPQQGELTVCLDLLIHQQDRARYDSAVGHLVESGAPLLVSGFEAPPVEFGPMTYFHEPLSVSIQRFDRVGIPVDSYRDTMVFLSLPVVESPASRDLRESTLRQALPLVQRPILLAEAIVRSRKALGFFPDHLPRCIEYPWIVDRMESDRQLRIVDAGAGVSVLPLMLADREHQITTLDSHPLVRSGTPQETWDEWGYLDYSEFHSRIQSHQIPYEEWDSTAEVDAVVSVSVVEHLPAEVRRAWLELASRQIRPGGLLLLTVDTVPFTDELWCYSEGHLVEDPRLHGTVQDLLRELTDADFEVIEVERSSWLPCSRVGMARICAKQ